jgi:predicted ABC-type transport system involved in lysophospholipase L1 biosynthesis ATPase subunit
MASGTSILLVTHDPSQAARLGGRRYHMIAGHMASA